MSKKKVGINPELEKAISELLKATMLDPTASLTDKTKILDRALKLEALKRVRNIVIGTATIGGLGWGGRHIAYGVQ